MTTTSLINAAALLRKAGDGKAEIVGGKVIRMSPTGGRPSEASGEIYASLLHYKKTQGGGRAFADNAGFLVNLPHRQSFSPDAAWYIGEVGMGFLEGAPAFAVEVRSEGDYGSAADRKIFAKIADYFAAGTKVVWDVDLLGQDTIRKYTADRTTNPIIFRAGDTADAEPAVPGWQFAVDLLFSEA